MMIFLAALSALSFSPAEEPRRIEGDRPPVRLWMNNDRRYRDGDRVRLQVDADVDGFLLVLNFDPDGRLRVLFPLDPRDDARVQAGRRYEVRGETYDAAFRAGGDGTGLIYSAVSEEPWRFDEIVLADRWDYTRLEIDRRSTDPEPEITELVQRLAGPRGFDYDVMGYRVYGESTYSTYNTYVYPGSPTYIYDDYLYCNNWNWRYDGCRRWPFDGGWSFGLGFYNPYYYGYYPYRYNRYTYGYGYPYYPSWPSRPSGRAPVLVGRPRNYTVVPRGTLGNTNHSGTAISGPARGPSGGVNLPPIDWRNRARPVREGVGREGTAGRDGVGRNVPGVSIPESNPPARRARGGDYTRAPEDRDRGNARPSRGEDYSRPPEATGRGPDRGNARPSRGEDYSRPPEATGRGPDRGNARPSRGEPSGREAPRDRSEPQRREPDRGSPPPRAEPRSSPPPRQSAPPAASGGSRGGDGGGHSRPRKP
jgi:uncharacterized protein DUF4384